MMMVRRQQERRAKVAGTHVIADGNFDRRASRKVSDSRDSRARDFPRYYYNAQASLRLCLQNQFISY